MKKKKNSDSLIVLFNCLYYFVLSLFRIKLYQINTISLCLSMSLYVSLSFKNIYGSINFEDIFKARAIFGLRVD